MLQKDTGPAENMPVAPATSAQPEGVTDDSVKDAEIPGLSSAPSTMPGAVVAPSEPLLAAPEKEELLAKPANPSVPESEPLEHKPEDLHIPESPTDGISRF